MQGALQWLVLHTSLLLEDECKHPHEGAGGRVGGGGAAWLLRASPLQAAHGWRAGPFRCKQCGMTARRLVPPLAGWAQGRKQYIGRAAAVRLWSQVRDGKMGKAWVKGCWGQVRGGDGERADGGWWLAWRSATSEQRGVQSCVPCRRTGRQSWQARQAAREMRQKGATHMGADCPARPLFQRQGNTAP